MPTYSRGDVVIVLYPFTDGVGRKARPAVVVSADALNAVSRDIIVAAITSNVTDPAEICDYEMSDWRSLNLIGPSRVRVSRIAAVELRKVRQNLGRLSAPDLAELEKNLRLALEL